MAAPTMLTGVRGPGALVGIDSWRGVWRPWELFTFNNSGAHGADADAENCRLTEIVKTGGSSTKAVYDTTFVTHAGYLGLKLTVALGGNSVYLTKNVGAQANTFSMVVTFRFNSVLPTGQLILFTRDETRLNRDPLGLGLSPSNKICLYDIVGNVVLEGTYVLQLGTTYTMFLNIGCGSYDISEGGPQSTRIAEWELYNLISYLPIDQNSASPITGTSDARFIEANFLYAPGSSGNCQVTRFGYSTAGPLWGPIILPPALPNFTEDLTLVWNTLSSFQKDLILRWSVRTGFNKDLILRWLTDGATWTEVAPVVTGYTEVPRPPLIWDGDPQEN